MTTSELLRDLAKLGEPSPAHSLVLQAANEIEALTRQVEELTKERNELLSATDNLKSCNIKEIERQWNDGSCPLCHEAIPSLILNITKQKKREIEMAATILHMGQRSNELQSSLTLSQAKVAEMREALETIKDGYGN